MASIFLENLCTHVLILRNLARYYQHNVRWAGHVARKGEFGIPQKLRKSRKRKASRKDNMNIKIGRSVVAGGCVRISSGSRLGQWRDFF
jgi:hypothetical protein